MTKSFSKGSDKRGCSNEKSALSFIIPFTSQAAQEDITSSWQRCRDMGIDVHCTTLPAINKAKETLNCLLNEWESIADLGGSFEEVFRLASEESECAVFYVDLELNIIMQSGNELFLKHLNSLNLGIGANLSEDKIGTNAVALASRLQRKTFIIGSEHYLDIFKNYASGASPIFMTDNIPIAYVMYIGNSAGFDHTLQDRLNQYIDLQNHLTRLQFNNLELSLKNEMLHANNNLKDSGNIFVDSHGLIINVNKWILEYFNLAAEDILGKYIGKVFPELTKVWDGLQSGEPLKNRELFFHQSFGKGSKLIVDCIVQKKQGETLGMIISLFESKLQPKLSSKKDVHDAHFTFDDLIGISPIFCEAKNIAEVAAVSNCNVMIIGESGSGKELFAQAIHNKSDRKNEAFISINCAAISKELIYSELFGYVEGAFTGAKKGGAPGKFELANKGTLFLDEISEIPNEMQAVLLRVLEGDTVSRIGSSVSIPIDVRVITATNRDICSSIATNQFRLDLYHRLCVVRIDIAPLRRRKDDIPVLANYFLQIFTSKHKKNILRITSEAMDYMEHCVWLGNVRELRNVIERGVIFCSSNELDISDLPKELGKHHKDPVPQIQNIAHSGDSLLQQFQEKLDEKRHIELLLKERNNNKTLVAQDMGITRATLYRRMKFFGIK